MGLILTRVNPCDMIHKFYLNVDGIRYRLEVKKVATPSNYSWYAHVFRMSEKSPLLVTSFKENERISIIKEWAIKGIKSYDEEMSKFAKEIGLI